MDIAVELSLYPLGQDLIPKIKDFIERLNRVKRCQGDHQQHEYADGRSLRPGVRCLHPGDPHHLRPGRQVRGGHESHRAAHRPPLSQTLDAIIAAPAAMSGAEVIAVSSGVGYTWCWPCSRSRWCWVAGGISSAIVIWLSAQNALPMQAGAQRLLRRRVRLWLLAAGPTRTGPRPAVVTLLAAALACWAPGRAARQCAHRAIPGARNRAAWPYLDSLTTWGSLFTTWLVARVKLENWLYWFVIDVVLTYLCIVQQLPFVGLLYATYLGISLVGFVAWLKTYRRQARAQ